MSLLAGGGGCFEYGCFPIFSLESDLRPLKSVLRHPSSDLRPLTGFGLWTLDFLLSSVICPPISVFRHLKTNPLSADLDHVLAHTQGLWEELRGQRIL